MLYFSRSVVADFLLESPIFWKASLGRNNIRQSGVENRSLAMQSTWCYVVKNARAHEDRKSMIPKQLQGQSLPTSVSTQSVQCELEARGYGLRSISHTQNFCNKTALVFRAGSHVAATSLSMLFNFEMPSGNTTLTKSNTSRQRQIMFNTSWTDLSIAWRSLGLAAQIAN